MVGYLSFFDGHTRSRGHVQRLVLELAIVNAIEGDAGYNVASQISKLLERIGVKCLHACSRGNILSRAHSSMRKFSQVASRVDDPI